MTSRWDLESYKAMAGASAQMCDLEDMAWSSWFIGDRAGVLAAVTGWLHVLVHGL